MGSGGVTICVGVCVCGGEMVGSRGVSICVGVCVCGCEKEGSYQIGRAHV